MSKFDQAVTSIRVTLGDKQDRIPWEVGWLGDGQGQVETARENWYLTRYPYKNSPAVPVFCGASLPVIDNLRIKVGYLPWEPGLFQIITHSDSRLTGNDPTTGSDSELPVGSGGQTGYSMNAGPHVVNHYYLGIDPVMVNWRQIMPLGVFPTSPVSLSVRVFGGYLPRNGTDAQVVNQVVDLSASVPESGARYILISFDQDGEVVVTDGDINEGGFMALTAADIPDTPSGNWRSCAIVAYPGQVAFREDRQEIDFYDLRFPEELPAGFGVSGTGGTIGRIPQWAGVSSLEDSTLVKSGAGVLTLSTGADPYTVTVPSSGQMVIGSSGTGNGVAVWVSPSALTNLPNNIGALTNDGAGNLTWVPGGGGSVTSVSGTLPISSSGGADPVISIADAKSDGTTKGAATFDPNDFADDGLGLITIDYVNGQAAGTVSKGFLTAADWNTFNGKQAAITFPLASNLGGTGIDNDGRTVTISTNSGTFNFAGIGLTLTIPDTGTAVLGTGAANSVAIWTAANTLSNLANGVGVLTNNGSGGLTWVPGGGGGIDGSGEAGWLTEWADTDTVQKSKLRYAGDGDLALTADTNITVHFPADGTVVLGAGTLAYDSINQTSGNHTHEITNSNNPGVTAQILSTDYLGRIILTGMGIGEDPAPFATGLHITKAISGADLWAINSNVQPSGTVSNAYGFATIINTNAASTVTNTYGIYIHSTSVGGFGATLENNYGIYIADQNTATNNYALVTNAGLVRINDTTDSGNPGAGALVVAGGLGVGKMLRAGIGLVGGTLTAAGSVNVTALTGSASNDALPYFSLYRAGAIEGVWTMNGTTLQYAVNPSAYTSAAMNTAAKFQIDNAGRVGIGIAPQVGHALFVTHGGSALWLNITDTGTNNAVSMFTLGHNTSGSPITAGFGVQINYRAESTTTTDTLVAADQMVWADPTHATRKGIRYLYVYDTAARTGISISTNGSAPTIGFLGATAVVRQTVSAAASAGGTGTTAGAYDTAAHRDGLISLVNSMRTALINLGLCA